MKRIASFHILSLLFMAGLMVLTLICHSGVPGWGALILRYFVGLVLNLAVVLAFDRWPEVKPVQWVHNFAPLFFILFIFDSLGYLIQYLRPDIDLALIRLDHWLFGVHPTLWLQRFIRPWLTDLLSLAYSTYYFLAVVFILVIYNREQKRGLPESIFIFVLGYYLSYIGYLLFPAIGPRFTMTELYTVPLDGGAITDFLRDTINSLEHNKRDCMPSGHTEIALITLGLAFRYSRKLFYIYLPMVAGLILATVYLRYHYVVDLLAGALLAAVCLVGGPWLYRKIGSRSKE
ncbi:MAG: phosphatase PAP2 family protein, partial [Desulfobacteraceae bacterium]